jgi:hypothetical protein
VNVGNREKIPLALDFLGFCDKKTYLRSAPAQASGRAFDRYADKKQADNESNIRGYIRGFDVFVRRSGFGAKHDLRTR